MRIIFTILTSLLIVSCAVRNEAFFTQTSDPQAKLRVSSIPSNNNFITKPIHRECIVKNKGETITTLGSKANILADWGAGNRLNMPLYDTEIEPKSQAEFYVPTNKEFSFQFAGIGLAGILPGGILYSYCRKIINFTPEAGKMYEALYFITTVENKKTCDVKFKEIKNVNGEFQRVEAANYEIVHKYCN